MRSLRDMCERYRGVLGLNRRNLELLERENPRDAVMLANSKLRTKEVLAAQAIPVPQTYVAIRTQAELHDFRWDVPDEFALKPSGGWRGGGIVVAVGKNGSGWQLADGQVAKRQALSLHILDILQGVFSSVGGLDEAYFERRLQCSRELAQFDPSGLPDIRVIVHRGRPILAMMRLPTKQSKGKANLHQGAVGVGIDLEEGLTVHAVHRGKGCTRHPDNDRPLVGCAIPHWREIISLAVRAAAAGGLGYTGVDIALDDTQGPVVLELNARPGLEIQLANSVGLWAALEPHPEGHALQPASGDGRRSRAGAFRGRAPSPVSVLGDG